MSLVEGAALGTRRLNPGPDSVTYCVTLGKSCHFSGPRCAIVKTGLGKWQSQRPPPTLRSVVLLLAPTPPLSPIQAYRGGKYGLGRLESLGEPPGRAVGPKPGQPISASSERSTVSLLLKLIPRGLSGTGVSTAPPTKGESQPRRGALRGLS